MSIRQTFSRVGGVGGINLGFRGFLSYMQFPDSPVIFQTVVLIFGFGLWSWTVFFRIKPVAAIPK